MNCKECPYIKDEFYRIENYIDGNNASSKIFYDHLSDYEKNEIISHECYCRKIDNNTGIYHCIDSIEDNIIKSNKTKKKGERKLNKRGKKRIRNKKYKKHLESLNNNLHHYPSPVYYKEETYNKQTGKYGMNEKPYYKRIYRGKCSSYHKKRSNKAIRRYKGEIGGKSGYKKIYDFWWELY